MFGSRAPRETDRETSSYLTDPLCFPYIQIWLNSLTSAICEETYTLRRVPFNFQCCEEQQTPSHTICSAFVRQITSFILTSIYFITFLSFHQNKNVWPKPNVEYFSYIFIALERILHTLAYKERFHMISVTWRHEC